MAIIITNNGKTTILTSGEQISSITPEPNTYVLGVDSITGEFEKLDPNGNIINFEEGGSGGGVNFSSVTYNDITNLINTNSLDTGSFYLINDFQTCYDQPDFDYNGSPITTGNYKQGPVEPILVLATSANTISDVAYQPSYPNDKIKYDWTWNLTEVTSGTSYGRITERIDEFNNRTDYDHRNILFKRYKLYTYRPGQPLNGTIEVLGDGTVNGVGTSFTGLTAGNIIHIDGLNPSLYEIVNITDDVTMTISGDTIPTSGPGFSFYNTIEETNDTSGYFSYKQTNVKTYDYVEYTTFGNAILNDYAKNNYIGNYANNYQTVSSGTFLLANNVLLEGQYESNKFGDYCYNNTFGTDNQNNTWGDYCYENVSTNDIDDNVIGHYFNNNLINSNLSSNQIGNYFELNKLLSENSSNFENNIIGNNFYNNIIYSNFYGNEILLDFRNNFIGDFGNLSNFEFYRNYIRNNFNANTLRQYFQNNQIGTNYQNNTINGNFIGNTILNGFNNNQVGQDFVLNNIGNGFNGNIIYDSFNQNTTDYYFNSNIISSEFNKNKIGVYFTNNSPSNNTLFGWNVLNTVSTRTYDTLYNSLNGGVGNRVLGKEFVMRVISTSQYFKIKFTQWTQGANGGGFKYTREEIDSNGNSLGSTITFTKTNYGSEVDVLVPGVVELTRDSQGGLYNTITDTPPFNGQWPGPGDTEWNSIYTEPINGIRFAYNKIGNNFNNNIIANDFGYGGNQAEGNIINDNFEYNTIGSFMYNNVIGNYFKNNNVGDNFENNTIKNYFLYNTILNGFESNNIGDYFGNNGTAPGSPMQNFIGDNFKYNNIGNFFGNDTNFPSVNGGTNGDGGNIIADNFQFNRIGDNFVYNVTDNIVDYNNIGHDAWFNYFGSNTRHNTIGDLFVGNTGVAGFGFPMGISFVSNKLSNYSAFNAIGDNFQYNSIGDFFGNGGPSNSIGNNFNNNKIGNYFGDDGSHTTGGNTIGIDFASNTIDNYFYSNAIADYFYQNTIANYFYSNTIADYFYENMVANYFSSNPNISYSFYSNVIGDYFQSNNIGQDFYYNTIDPSFNNNTTTINFNSNKIKTQIGSVDFTDFYGNITGFTYSDLGSSATDGTYTSLTQDSTTGIGVSATFDIEVSGGTVVGVTGITQGKLYAISDTLTILGTQILGTDGVDDVVITITGISPLPSVYESYTCDIFERQGGTKRLSYYDSNDILTITNINE